MAVSTSASGAKANSTAKENTSRKENAGKVSGRWARESNGLKRTPNSELQNLELFI
jgi:hypothetical protein